MLGMKHRFRLSIPNFMFAVYKLHSVGGMVQFTLLSSSSHCCVRVFGVYPMWRSLIIYICFYSTKTDEGKTKREKKSSIFVN